MRNVCKHREFRRRMRADARDHFLCIANIYRRIFIAVERPNRHTFERARAPSHTAAANGRNRRKKLWKAYRRFPRAEPPHGHTRKAHAIGIGVISCNRIHDKIFKSKNLLIPNESALALGGKHDGIHFHQIFFKISRKPLLFHHTQFVLSVTAFPCAVQKHD